MYSMQLERHEVDAFAQILLAAYVGAAADARTFTAEWGSPPTRMDKSHRFRSIAQAQIAQSDQFALHQEYMESGRVQVTDMSTRDSYLIRSKAAIDIEEALSGAEQLVLFEPPRQNRSGHPKLLAYTFERGGMRLWACATKRMVNRQRLVPAGELDHVGFWPFAADSPPDGGGDLKFDQGENDPFDDLGEDLDFGEADGL
ncbi:hypothetical protein OEM_33030 [Mycobacterium intracellulare subsp. yongonense 05-1390]|uniref:Uncharacterized protein n=5 Tax=Mycobacterium avium complex (MAC) TaxID=120793 RepID=A0AAI8SL11_MYCAV|nr:hypothetical protein [Mycobacterium intracellulare]AFS16442.1 CAD protein [Mycobacterium intracellulare subsp. intracellulare MTCC 9506]AGP64838.1 hypothetical protein OEM_33030 [Mycobacterium intracellulare subsp. yongonense 05-1390]ELR82903.1 hypothetical protein W7U_17860 [Mycobacterium sp. H4Y]ETZ27711.1 hypothetical protein L842_4607 [Mycobacterium intracellulare MIN_052511_1280]KKC04226.1 hypothetical protein WU83_14815 [Mycobacterium nebraskense]MCA2245419.1 hypothetical protein [My